MASEELAALVRDSLDEQYEALVIDPRPWPSIEPGIRRASRRRRRRGAMVGAAALAVLLVAGGIGALGGLPMTRDRAVAPASRLIDVPTRGSLAGDAAYLAGLRTVGLGLVGGQAATADQVKILYAGDVGEHRLALVDVPAPKLPGGRGQLWLHGRRGDPPPALSHDPNGLTMTEKVAFTWVPNPAGGNPPPAGTGAFVVLSVHGSVGTYLLAPPTYGRDGSVSWSPRPARPAGPGWWQGTVPWNDQQPATLLIPPGAVELTPLTGNEQPPRVDAAGALPPVHGTVRPGWDSTALTQAQQASRLPVAGSSRRLLWSGTLRGARTDVVAVTAPSGAHILYVHVDRPDGHDSRISSAARVAPAGPLDRVAMAWRVPGEPSLPEFVGLMGPSRAERARVRAWNDAAQDVPLSGGVGEVSLQGADHVEFLDGHGRVVAECDITDGDQLPLPSKIP